jgi:hypothetical protein
MGFALADQHSSATNNNRNGSINALHAVAARV